MEKVSFFIRFFQSKYWNFCRNHRDIVFVSIFLLIVLIEGYRQYRYYNRLELIRKVEYNGDTFEHYLDWSKSTYYYEKFSERHCDDNYYVIKKNGEIYFKYQHNYPFAESYQAFFFKRVEQDSLVFVQRGDEDFGVVYLKMPLNKNKITKKDVRIIAIYPRILKNGSKRQADDTTHYVLDDYKKVPKEVINYDNVISDYEPETEVFEKFYTFLVTKLLSIIPDISFE